EAGSLQLALLHGQHQIREVARQRLLVAAMDHDLVAVLEGDRPKAIPLRLVLPGIAAGQLGLDLRLHRGERWHDAQSHAPYTKSVPSPRPVLHPRATRTPPAVALRFPVAPTGHC